MNQANALTHLAIANGQMTNNYFKEVSNGLFDGSPNHAYGLSGVGAAVLIVPGIGPGWADVFGEGGGMLKVW